MAGLESENIYGIRLRESANDGSDFSNPPADYRVVFLGEDGEWHARDSAGTVTDLGGSGGVTVQDEGTPLATTATTLDFVGGGVTATGAGATKTITIPGGGAGISGSVLSPSSDTYINSQAATTNNDSSTTIWVGNSWNTNSFTRFALLTFDTSSLSGDTVYTAELCLFRTDTAGAGLAGRRLEARRVLRAYNPTQVTWNIYSTGNNWTTAGAEDVGTDIATAVHGGTPFGVAPANSLHNSWHVISIGTLLKESLDAAETTLRIIVGANVNDASSNAVQFASQDHATAAFRPQLRIIHS